ncbi:uncharacterized protein VTP21DRAFT_406 [Calcarisporiella thermophila]|uniref:uncharacterized protein n=1 Tax=Calcarisporiella thermophila TaxID=911321 RepID=UPI0037439074
MSLTSMIPNPSKLFRLGWAVISIALFLLPSFVRAKAWGDSCDPSPRYSDASKHYIDDCQSPMLACDGENNTCVYKGCRNTDYLPEWNLVIPFPVRCPSNTSYCPDNNLHCMPLRKFNESCEPSRDDECEGKFGICLNNKCALKIRTLNQPCVIDITEYRRMGYDGEHSILQRVVRDDCAHDTFCEDSTGKCIEAKPLGAQCEQDRECISDACNEAGVCDHPLDAYRQAPIWVFVLIGAAILFFVLLTLLLLWVLHRHHRRQVHRKRARFFEEQEAFRQMLMPDVTEGNITLSVPGTPNLRGHSSMNRSASSLNSLDDCIFSGSDKGSTSRLGASFAKHSSLDVAEERQRGSPSSRYLSLPPLISNNRAFDS